MDLLILGAWFGLATGLLEGLSRTVLQSFGEVSWDLLLTAADVKILWVAPFFYVMLFTLAGAALALLARRAPRLPITRAAVFGFGAVGFADVLSSSGRLIWWGVIMLAMGLAVALTRLLDGHERTALRFWRRSVAWMAVLALLAYAGVETGLRIVERRAAAVLPAAAPNAPNVLIIIVDTLRADHLSLLGYARKTSPNLEKIAQQSVLFEDAMATSSWTLPSHGSIVTGRYPSEHGAEKFGLAERNLTLAEVLRGRGYLTGAFSANEQLFSRAFGFGQGFIRFEDSFHSPGDMVSRTLLGNQIYKHLLRPLGFEDIPGRKRAADVNRSLLRWLDGENHRPFFAMLNYFDLHDPYLPPQPYRGKFSKRPNPGGVFNTLVGRDYRSITTPEILEDEIAAYDGAIAYMDDQLGVLMEELERRGLSQNTLLIITSDHGESFSEHGVFAHGTSLYREQVRVPILLRWPGKIPGGLRVTSRVSLVELAGTVMDLIGGEIPREFRGPSLAVAWKNPSAMEGWPNSAAQLAATPEANNPKLLPYSGDMRAMITAKWYFIVHDKFGPQLFNDISDPQQMNDLSGTPDGKRIVAEFEEQLRELQTPGAQHAALPNAREVQ